MEIRVILFLAVSILLHCNIQAQTETGLPACGCLPADMFKTAKDGRPLLPEWHPDAQYFNDPQYWQWQNIDDKDPRYGGMWDVKPEYMDSIPDGSGGWLKAAFWTIARWKKEEAAKDSLNVNPANNEIQGGLLVP
jgi:hypothetical protein